MYFSANCMIRPPLPVGVAVGNGAGLTASFVGLLSGNSALGNSVGIDAFSDSGPVQGNNIFGNQCGMKREGPSPLIAANNYWGAATGPGADPADNTCLGTITTSPFATAPFNVINPLPAPAAYRVNAGGPLYVAVNGGQWIADSYFNTGSVITTTSAIANTTDDPLYQAQRIGTSTAPELKYSFAAQNGAYQVKLLFAEIVAQAAGQRVFNVKIQNNTVLSNFDIFASAGAPNKALTKTFNTTVTNGELTIEFDHVVGLPAVAAMEVLPQ